MASPVKVGEEYDVTIETVGSKGDGVAKIKGYVVFVKNVSQGDKIKVRITKTLEKVGFGEIVGKQVMKSDKTEETIGEKEAADESTKESAHEASDIVPEEEGGEVPEPDEEETEEETKDLAEVDEDVPEPEEEETEEEQ